MAIDNFQCARHSVVSIIEPTKVRPGKKRFKIKVLRRLENAILRLIFANKALHKIAIMLMLWKQNS